MKFNLKKPSKKIIILIVFVCIIISLATWNKLNSERSENQYSPIIQNTGAYNSQTQSDDATLDLNSLDIVDQGNTFVGTSTNLSDAVTNNLFANAVNMSDTNTATPENVNNLVNNLMNGIQNNFSYIEYTSKSLPTKQATRDTIRLFASSFATLQIQLINNLASNTDPKDLAKIYADHAKNLYQITTPSDIADTELQIINNFSEVASAFDAFAKEQVDPMKVPLAVKAYQDAGNTQQGLVLQVGKYLEKNDIINSLDDTARNYWTLVITQ